MCENGTRDFPVTVAASADAPLRALQVPIGELVPHEPPRRFRVLAEAQSGVALFGTPAPLFRARGPKGGVALENRGAEPAEYPSVGEGELAVAKLVDAPHRCA